MTSPDLTARARFRAWRRRRPLVGGLLVALGGIEMFFSGQLDIGQLHIQLGIEGLQATVIPLVLVLLGILLISMPAHRIFYGVIALAVAVYSLVGVNLGGFLLGMLLSTVGGIIAVSWAPPRSQDEPAPTAEEAESAITGAGDEARASRGRADRGDASAGRRDRGRSRAGGRRHAAGTTVHPDPAPVQRPVSVAHSQPHAHVGIRPANAARRPGGPGAGPDDARHPDVAGAHPASAGLHHPAAQAAVVDENAPVFTQPSAQLGAQSLSFRGIPLVRVVTVPLADGTRITVLKMTADEITIDGFALTVRRATGPALVTTADRMTLSGHVSVYVNSLSATTADGKTLTLGADTPPPADGIAPGLARVTLGLVGTTADSIVYTNTDQKITQPG